MLKGRETVVDCLFAVRAHHPKDGTINQSINQSHKWTGNESITFNAKNGNESIT